MTPSQKNQMSPTIRKFVCHCLPGLLALCLAESSMAQSTAPEKAPPGQPAPGSIDAARDSVRSATEQLASNVDSWFGDRPFWDGGRVTDGTLGISVYKRQDLATEVAVGFNAQFKLPNFEDHTYIFTGRDDPKEVINGKPASFTRQQRLLSDRVDERTYFAGLGRMVSDAIDVRVGLRGGLKAYAQARYRRLWTPALGQEIEFRETLFWTPSDQLGTTTALSFQQRLSPTWMGRWLTVATVTQNDNDLEWNSSLGVFWSPAFRRMLSLELLATGKQGTGVQVTDYGLQARWEQPVHKDWLIGELVFGHHWPRADASVDRGNAWAIGTGLKMLF